MEILFMLKHIFKKIIFPVAILFILSSAFVFLLTTERGLRFSFTVATKIIPGKLTAQKIDGSLLGPIDIEKLSFENKGMSMVVNIVRLDWQVENLFLSKIKIKTFYIDSLKIKIKKATNNKSKSALKDINVNLNKLNLLSHLQVEDIQLHNISWQQDAHLPIKINSIVLQAHQNKENITLLQGKILAQDTSLLVQGTLQKVWNINWRLHLSNLQNFSQEATGSVNCTGKIYGLPHNFEIDTAIKVTQFKYNNIAFAKLQGKVDVDLSRKKNSWFTLNITAPKISSLHFDQFKLAGRVLPNKLKKQDLKFNLDLDTTTISFPVGANSQFLQLEKGNIQGSFNQHGFSAESVLLISQQDPIKIALKLPKLKHFTALANTQPLYAQVLWQTKNLAFLQTVLPQVQNIHGTLDVQYAIDGTLQQPKIFGTAKLTNTSLYLPKLDIQLQNVELSAHSKQNKTTYQAMMRSGVGFLNVSGETFFAPNMISSKFFIEGKNFLVANTPEYKVTISPQLELQTRETALELSGKIFIPQATLAPGYFGRSSLLPPEVVYVKKGKVEKAESLNLYTQIQLDLGDNVFIDVMGLDGKVTGQLKLIDDPQKSTTALGTLYIKNAHYTLGGKQLQVTKGSLHFFGGAVTNPEVNAEIIRDFNAANITTPLSTANNNLTVGIKMHGMLDNIKTAFFSIPTGLTNPDILSYLIIGQPSQQAAGNKAQLLLQAASTLNLGGTGKVSNLLKSLRKKLGFSELGLTQETQLNAKSQKLQHGETSNPGGLTTNTAFALGRFLTPKLYINYSIGLLEPINIFRAKYYMGKYWSIQSESSPLGNGADLFYTIESD